MNTSKFSTFDIHNFFVKEFSDFLASRQIRSNLTPSNSPSSNNVLTLYNEVKSILSNVPCNQSCLQQIAVSLTNATKSKRSIITHSFAEAAKKTIRGHLLSLNKAKTGQRPDPQSLRTLMALRRFLNFASAQFPNCFCMWRFETYDKKKSLHNVISIKPDILMECTRSDPDIVKDSLKNIVYQTVNATERFYTEYGFHSVLDILSPNDIT